MISLDMCLTHILFLNVPIISVSLKYFVLLYVYAIIILIMIALAEYRTLKNNLWKNLN